ncbi:DEAD/DEAH box helicase [Shouchella lehensis]|uniref:ATP-dependent RNA helicase n=1 Tax=Shouchella lehensis G1 TaxID=1246626 RepID=A0A060LW39_9BACI|nr:DEAD/DEAH box helicase [Shouchella lehensis]AIC95471.1 ATP-dependent RNA helicase [Shouchella lehensis G1]RQW21563.1 DEAD/DEAH box helicase [Bacillus sp. C1-1]
MIKQLTIDLPEEIGANLVKKGIEEPTPIQDIVIPRAIQGDSLMFRSQTGSGKTLAYVLPLLSAIAVKEQTIQGIIVAPSQELAVQIETVIKEVTTNTDITSMAFIGGANINRQVEKLKKSKPHIAVGTPGRLMELVRLKKLKLTNVRLYVLDEVDRLVEEQESWKDVEELGKRLGYDVQGLFASATIPKGLEDRLKVFSPKVEKIEENTSTLPEQIEHVALTIEERDRVDTVRKIIHAEQVTKGIVFVNQLERLVETVDKLRYRKIQAVGLSSEQTKIEREQAISQFKNGTATLLVATDVAARGIDVEKVTHIIQLNATRSVESYLHRAGRTGRVNEAGKVISLFNEQELYLKEKYEKRLAITITDAILQNGALVTQ